MNDHDRVWELPENLKIRLEAWFDNFNLATVKPLSSGYQGHVWLFEDAELNLIVKTVPHHSPISKLLKRTLKHEYAVYKKMYGMQGIPRCYGFYRERFLVLEYIQSQTLRQTELKNREYFYKKLFSILEALHSRNIAHADLKRKDNILVVNGCEPVLVDFGAASILKSGFYPVNHFVFRLARQFDLNAWLKHKYRRQYDRLSPEDSVYYKKTLLESLASQIKRIYKTIIKKNSFSK